MPDLQRIACTRCKESVYNCFVDGPHGTTTRVPLVVRITLGQPGDTGLPVDINGPDVRVPSVVRSLMMTPIARIELCVKCFAELFGLDLVSAAEDTMYDSTIQKEYQWLRDHFFFDESVPAIERHHLMHARALHAVAVGRRAANAEDFEDIKIQKKDVIAR